MEACQKVYEILRELSISYEIVEHPPAFSTEEADNYIEGKEGVRTKTLFLCNRKKKEFFLVVMDDKKRLDIKKLGSLIGEKGLQFASEEKLMEKMAVAPGAVSIFGLLNNSARDIKVYFDKEILSDSIMTFHPNDNTKTLFLSTDDVRRFLSTIGFPLSIVEL
ncbi:prolyl-tRNA synthetase associated domain-containing protein [Aminipila sp.]|uniref:prolyl-tRNA synthetase associated domain-containing protein n=1 Tax=Aminipila sp. TaxID=2060095 RepID=UPI00289E12CA|nr:prolyl-tRNA synthetase associated domain-containing protein [Aminipila sp.]